MTSDGVLGLFRHRINARSGARRAAAAALIAAIASGSARAAEPSYPFEGTWLRANRVCAANAPRPRTYTAHEVTFATGHCTFRKVAAGGGQFEIFEECRRAERPGNFTETIRMLGPDLMQMRRQAARLKIARPLRYARCAAAAPAPHHAEDHPAKPPEAKPLEARPAEPKPPEAKP